MDRCSFVYLHSLNIIFVTYMLLGKLVAYFLCFIFFPSISNIAQFIIYVFILRQGLSVTEAGVQWHDLGSLQRPTPRFK